MTFFAPISALGVVVVAGVLASALTPSFTLTAVNITGPAHTTSDNQGNSPATLVQYLSNQKIQAYSNGFLLGGSNLPQCDDSTPDYETCDHYQFTKNETPFNFTNGLLYLQAYVENTKLLRFITADTGFEPTLSDELSANFTITADDSPQLQPPAGQNFLVCPAGIPPPEGSAVGYMISVEPVPRNGRVTFDARTHQGTRVLMSSMAIAEGMFTSMADERLVALSRDTIGHCYSGRR